VIGILTEKHTLKRYSDELDRQRRASVRYRLLADPVPRDDGDAVMALG
jgi:hypothetical protein